MSFMAEYLPAPPHPSVPQQDHISLSPPRHGGSWGGHRLLRPGGSVGCLGPCAQCAFCGGGVLNLTPSLKDTSPHALAGPGLILHMGGALTLVAVSPLPPSRPLWVLGDIIPGMLRFLSRPHPHQTPPPILRFSGGGSNSSDAPLQSSSKNSSIWGGGSSVSSASVPNVPSTTRGVSFPSPTPLVMPPPGPIPFPVDRFTLPVIKNAADYLAARDLIFYWLRRPGFSTARPTRLSSLTPPMPSPASSGRVRSGRL